MTHDIEGEWQNVDNSSHRLEAARTKQRGVIAFRYSEDRGNVLTMTAKQIAELPQSETVRKLVGTPTS